MNKKKIWGKILSKRNYFVFFSIFFGVLGASILAFKNSQNIEAYSVNKEGDFRLSVENKWDNGSLVNYANLTWDQVGNLSQNGGYTIEQSEDGNTWNARSSKYGKAINVLNVYPNIDGSNTLKAWMDGLGLTDLDGNNLINVTPVSMSSFNANFESILKDSNGKFLYDVVYFGSWDWFNHADLTQNSSVALQSFINSGRGVLFGHDSINGNFTVKHWLNDFAPQVGLTLSTVSVYGTGGSTIKLINDGYLMKYPFEMANGLVMTIPTTHTFGNAVDLNGSGVKWLEFVSPFSWGNVNKGAGDGNFYLMTNNNLGMIQTGHSNGQSTVDERKILANTLYNLAQLTEDNYGSDYTVKDDVAPVVDDVQIRCGSNDALNIKVNGTDSGKEYMWKVNAYTKNGTKTSDVVSEEIVSNINGYFYEVTDSETSSLSENVEGYKNEYGRIDRLTYSEEGKNGVLIAPDSDELTYETTGSFSINEAPTSEKYLHVVAVDRASNISEVKTYKISDIVQLVDFEIERTGDEAKLVNLALDDSLNKEELSIELQFPKNIAIKNFTTLALPTGWFSYTNSDVGTNTQSMSFAMTSTTNDLATITNFLTNLRFTISDPVNQEGNIRIVFHEKIITSWDEHPDGKPHYYSYVDSANTTKRTWMDYYNASKQTSYRGLKGYLATMTSLEEHEFIFNNIAKKPGLFGGTRALKADGSKINDDESISTSLTSFKYAASIANKWYWVDGPEAGQVFYNTATRNNVSGPVEGMYQGFYSGSSEPNNAGGVECILQFALGGTMYWNDKELNTPYGSYNTGYFIEYSEYGGQIEREELSDSCWKAAIPQKVEVKAYDDEGTRLPEGDLLYDQELRIGKEVTIVPKELRDKSFEKLLNLDDSESSFTVSITNVFQEKKAIYNSRISVIHVRQVVENRNQQLVIPITGFGEVQSSNDANVLSGEKITFTMPSGEGESVEYIDRAIGWNSDTPFYHMNQIIPSNYRLVGYVSTTELATHSSQEAVSNLSIDLSRSKEYWITVYIQPTSTESIPFYSWDYAINKFGTIVEK